MTLENNRAPLQHYFKLYASFRSHWWNQTGVTVRKRPIWVSPETPNLGQLRRLLEPCDLEIWRMTLKNNRAPLSNIKLYASFHHHMWIQTWVTVRKRLSWIVTSMTLTFDLWPWPFAWTLLLSLVKLLKISWSYDGGNIVKKVWQTDRRTDGQMDRRTDRRKIPFVELLGRS